MKLKFSVLMSVYENENSTYLYQCLMSLLNQTLKANEVILVEDGVIPQSLKDVIEQFRDKLNIRSIYLKKNHGLAVALNVGLKHCCYDLIARMDSDDICLPNRFEQQVNSFKEEKDLDVLGTFAQEIDKNSIKLKILGSGVIKDKINIEADLASKSALEKLEKIGGSIQLKK